MKNWILTAALHAAVATPLVAQGGGLAAPCAELPEQGRDYCAVVAQAAESAQPQLGILIAGGNPTLGTASTGGLRLGVLPRVSATARVNLVFVELPDILAEQAGEAAANLNEVVGVPAPAFSGSASLGVFPGVSLAPTVGGIGSVDLLGTATWLPFRAFGVEGFDEGDSDVSYGVGARIGLLRESFTLPGASVSLMYHNLGTTTFGNACESEVPLGTTTQGDGYTVRRGVCAGEGDAGEITFDLASWSTRAAVSKRLLGVGLTAGVGYDRMASDVAYAVHVPTELGEVENYFEASGMELDNDRWSAFVNGSFTMLVATLAVEAGWLQGGETLDAFRGAVSDFDPGEGTFFGSVGLRLAF